MCSLLGCCYWLEMFEIIINITLMLLEFYQDKDNICEDVTCIGNLSK